MPLNKYKINENMIQKEIGEDEDERNEEKSASCRRYDVGSHRFTDGLHQHIGEHDAGYERKTEHLPSQSHRPTATTAASSRKMLMMEVEKMKPRRHRR